MISLERHVIPRTSVAGFGATIETWTAEEKAIFLNDDLTLEQLDKQCVLKQAHVNLSQRELLYQSLSRSYASLPPTEAVTKNLSLLRKENTMTLTTGHQLSLGLGPLFLLYKALHVINLCEAYNQRNQPFTLVPVFWLASEDHDFEEIKSTHVFNKTFTWETDQSGAVGRFRTDGLTAIYEEIKALFPQDLSLEELLSVQEDTYGQHYRALLHRVFGTYGLVIIDGDEPSLKRSFLPWMKQELESSFVADAVTHTNTMLQSFGKPIQAHARPINLFYLSHGKRTRIIPTPEAFTVDGTILSKEALFSVMDDHPERFSPNVLFRPFYQESILPNVGYVGGSGELTYWAQLKGLFQKTGMVFPLLKTRVSAFISKNHIPSENIHTYFLPFNQQIDALLGKESDRDAVFTRLEQPLEALLSAMTEGISTLGDESKKWSGAQAAAITSSIEQYKHRWQKEQKQQLDTKIKRLERIHQAFYPQGIPQERHTHLLHFCGTHSLNEWIEALKNGLDPFCSDIHIFVQNHEAA